MKNDEKGFSLIELLAIIVITSVIIVPLMTTFVNFFEINNRMHDRRNAVGIADVAQNSVSRFDFLDIYDELQTQKLADQQYMMLTMVEGTPDQCNFTFTDPVDQDVCEMMFTMPYNNMSMPVGDMQIYFIDYNLSETDHLYFDDDTLPIPPEVLSTIHNMPPSSGEDVNSIMRYIIFLQYSHDPRGVIILDGVFIND